MYLTNKFFVTDQLKCQNLSQHNAPVSTYLIQLQQRQKEQVTTDQLENLQVEDSVKLITSASFRLSIIDFFIKEVWGIECVKEHCTQMLPKQLLPKLSKLHLCALNFKQIQQ